MAGLYLCENNSEFLYQMTLYDIMFFVPPCTNKHFKCKKRIWVPAGDTKSHDRGWRGGNRSSGSHRHRQQWLWDVREDRVHRRPPFSLLPQRPQDWAAPLSRKSCWSKTMMTWMPECGVPQSNRLNLYHHEGVIFSIPALSITPVQLPQVSSVL